MKFHNYPSHKLRPRESRWSTKQRMIFAVKSSERQREPAKVTLSTPPWAQEGKDGRRGKQTNTR